MKLDNLPSMCATYHPTSKEPILVFRGESGYTPLKDPDSFNVEEFNKSENISENQVKAMLHGSMFGWNTLSKQQSLSLNQT
jgi:hypothetical protein